MDFVKLKTLCEFEKGSTGLAKAKPGEYPLVATGAKRKTCNTYQFDTKAVCIPLVSSTGHGHASLKNVHYQEGMFALGSILVALTSKDDNKLDIQFLHLYLSQLKDQVLVPLMSGAANVALSVKKIQNIEIPLPAIKRQREIVERFKSIVIEEDELKTELNHQQILLKKLRQQILQEAIEGKLTADWRAQNPDVEPASELLTHIMGTQKEWIEIKIKQGYKEASVMKKKLENLAVQPTKGGSLPDTWIFCSLIAIVNLIVDCHNKTASYEARGIKLVRTTNVRDRKLDLATTKYVSEATYEFWSRRARPQKGDILFTREAPVGEAAIIPTDENICMGQRMMLVRVFENLVNRQYLLYAVTEPSFLKRLEENQKGAMVKHLRVGDVENALIAFPPLDEQEAIVAKVEKLFALCDQLETQFTQNQTHSEQLMQAVLKEAFSYTPEVEKTVDVPPPDNITPFKPRGADYYKRTLLAAEIVHQLHKEPTLGHLKLQKLIYLCQKIESMQLPTQFLKQVAGPYDNRMARSIDKQLKDKKWFSYGREQVPKYTPLEKAGEHQTDFDKYFAPQKNGIAALIRLFRKAKSDQLEIVATLYACWEDILNKQEPLSEDLLVQRFYEWSEEKSKYEASRIYKAIEWMRNKDIVPDPEQIAHA